MGEPIHSANSDSSRVLFRHTLATLAYRGGKAIRNAPAGFSGFQGGHGLRTPGQILAHIADLLDWALSTALGKQTWQDSKPQTWEQDVERFHAALKKFDDFLASSETVQAPLEKLFQGPIADALTHVGQLAMLRRMAGSPIRGENFYRASVVAGQTGADQPAPIAPFS